MKISRREITDCITKSVISYFVHKRTAVFREIGLKQWGSRRADIVCFHLKRQTITIIEVKSCHADFKSDSKYLEYLEFCNIMYIAVPNQCDWILSYKDQLQTSGIGIMSLQLDGTVKVIVNAKKRTMKKKTKMGILTRLVWRCASYSLRTHLRRKRAVSPTGIVYQDLVERKLK